MVRSTCDIYSCMNHAKARIAVRVLAVYRSASSSEGNFRTRFRIQRSTVPNCATATSTSGLHQTIYHIMHRAPDHATTCRRSGRIALATTVRAELHATHTMAATPNCMEPAIRHTLAARCLTLTHQLHSATSLGEVPAVSMGKMKVPFFLQAPSPKALLHTTEEVMQSLPAIFILQGGRCDASLYSLLIQCLADQGYHVAISNRLAVDPFGVVDPNLQEPWASMATLNTLLDTTAARSAADHNNGEAEVEALALYQHQAMQNGVVLIGHSYGASIACPVVTTWALGDGGAVPNWNPEPDEVYYPMKDALGRSIIRGMVTWEGFTAKPDPITNKFAPCHVKVKPGHFLVYVQGKANPNSIVAFERTSGHNVHSIKMEGNHFGPLNPCGVLLEDGTWNQLPSNFKKQMGYDPADYSISEEKQTDIVTTYAAIIDKVVRASVLEGGVGADAVSSLRNLLLSSEVVLDHTKVDFQALIGQATGSAVAE